MSAALENRQPDALDMLVTPEWPRAVLELVMRSKCPKGIEPDAFYLFMRQCQVSGMNPLIDQAHCVERRTNVGTKDAPKWVTQHVFQPTIAGMRARALRFPDFLGLESAPVFAEDRFEVDRGAATVTHVSKPFGKRLVGAWARVTLKGRQPILVTLEMGTRPQIGPVWSQDPQGQLTKCCEALALRKAYPESFSGHTSEEMAEANEAARVSQLLSVAPVVDVAAPAKPQGRVAKWGPHKDVPFDLLTDEQAREQITTGQEKLDAGENKKAPWRASVERDCADLTALLASRVPALVENTTATQRLETTSEDTHALREPTDAEWEAEKKSKGAP